jgi:hypothetical protein
VIGRLSVGSYTEAELALLSNESWKYNNNVRSVTITPGYQVTLYDRGDLTGKSITLTRSVRCLSDYSFMDITSSLVIKAGNP